MPALSLAIGLHCPEERDVVNAAQMHRLIEQIGIDDVHTLFLGGPAVQRAVGVDLSEWHLEVHPPVTILYRLTLADLFLERIADRSDLRLLRARLLRAPRDLVTRAELEEVRRRLHRLEREIATGRQAERHLTRLLAEIVELAADPEFRAAATAYCQKRGAARMTAVFEIIPGVLAEGLPMRWLLE